MSSYSDSQNSQKELEKRDRENLKRAAWYCRPEFCICLWATLCALAILAAIIALALIPIYRRNRTTSTNNHNHQEQDSVCFLLTYVVNSTNVTDLLLANRTELANRLMERYDIKGITIRSTELISLASIDWNRPDLVQYNITQCLSNANTANSILRILFCIPYSAGCYSNACRETFVEDTRQRIIRSNYRMSLPYTGSDGTTYNTDMNLCLLNQTRAGSPSTGIEPTDVTTTSTASTSTNRTLNGTMTRTTSRSTTRTTTRTTTRRTTRSTTRRTTRSTTSITTTSSPTSTDVTTETETTMETITDTDTDTTSATTTTATTTTATTTTATTTTDIPCPTTCNPQQTCVRGVCVNVGTLGMALTWSRPGDGDIVLTTPNGRHIYWRNRGPSANTDNGNLDQDDQNGTGPENIYWPSNGPDPPTGTYHVCFQPYAFTPPPSPTNPVQATVNIRRPDGTTTTVTKTITERYTFNNQCSPSSSAYMGSVSYP